MDQFKYDLIINAGGSSRRMGADKALLAVPPDDTPLVRYVCERLSGIVTGQTLVITNDPLLAAKAGLPSSVRLIPDDYPGAGALGGLATGLARCSGWAIAVACDMPLVDPRLFASLAGLTECIGGPDGDRPWDAIVPRSGGRPQPLHAFYHRRCLPAIVSVLDRDGRRFVDFYDAVAVRFVDEPALRQIDPDLLSFVNVNTPEEWQRALAQIDRGSGG